MCIFYPILTVSAKCLSSWLLSDGMLRWTEYEHMTLLNFYESWFHFMSFIIQSLYRLVSFSLLIIPLLQLKVPVPLHVCISSSGSCLMLLIITVTFSMFYTPIVPSFVFRWEDQSGILYYISGHTVHYRNVS